MNERIELDPFVAENVEKQVAKAIAAKNLDPKAII